MDEFVTSPSAVSGDTYDMQSDMAQPLSQAKCKIPENKDTANVGDCKWAVTLLIFWSLFTDRLLTTMPIVIFPKELVCDTVGTAANENRQGCVDDSFVLIFFACKPMCQAIANVFVGKVVDRHGPWVPLRVALVVMLVSTIGCSIGLFLNEGHVPAYLTYPILVFSRSVQGLASASIMNSGLTLVSRVFPKDELGTAIGFVMTGMALGVLAGPLVGGLFAAYWPAWAAFALAAAWIAIGKVLQREFFHGFVAGHGEKVTEQQDVQSAHVWSDPLVLIIVFANFAVAIIIAMLEPMVPFFSARLSFYSGPPRNHFLWSSAAISFVLYTPFAGYLSDALPKHVMAVGIAMLALGAGVIFVHLHALVTISGLVCVGVSMAFIVTTTPSLLMAIAEFRGAGSEYYGRYFATQDVSAALGFIIGPITIATVDVRNTLLEKVTSLPAVFCVLGIFVVMLLPVGVPVGRRSIPPRRKEFEQEMAIIRVEEGRRHMVEDGRPPTCTMQEHFIDEAAIPNTRTV